MMIVNAAKKHVGGPKILADFTESQSQKLILF